MIERRFIILSKYRYTKFVDPVVPALRIDANGSHKTNLGPSVISLLFLHEHSMIAVGSRIKHCGKNPRKKWLKKKVARAEKASAAVKAAAANAYELATEALLLANEMEKTIITTTSPTRGLESRREKSIVQSPTHLKMATTRHRHHRQPTTKKAARQVEVEQPTATTSARYPLHVQRQRLNPLPRGLP